MPNRTFLFYAKTAATGPGDRIAGGYTWTLWRPSSGGITPAGISPVRFGIWWCFHSLHVFHNREYGQFVIYQGDTVVHRSVITPGYFRFPFMDRSDLQIGDTWTSADHRGKGLATFALRQITDVYNRTGCRYWYVVEEDNTASIRVVEKAGFCVVAHGTRQSRYGIRLFGAFRMEQYQTPPCFLR